MNLNDLKKMKPSVVRQLIRTGKIVSPTSGMCEGHLQGNLAIIPKELAYDFLLFAQRNPKACPILEVTDVGSTEAHIMAPGSDIRYDIPKYRIYKHGKLVEEVNNIEKYWRDDFVAFIIGCSFSFEKALIDANIPIRHIENCHNVPMYLTNIETTSAGIFHGKMVVSMRPIPYNDVVRACNITARFPAVHGAPVHVGNPEQIGIKDINKPDFGEPSQINENEVPVFWACGVTPQSIAMESKPEIMITHSPGYMLILDKTDSDVSIF